jgi:hypothetical protein
VPRTSRVASIGLVTFLPFVGCGESIDAQKGDAVSSPDVSTQVDASVANVATPSDATDEDVDGRDAEQQDSEVRDNDEPDIADAFDASEADTSANRFSFEPIALEGEPLAITEMRFIPGAADEFLLLEKPGTIRHYRLTGSSASLLGSYRVNGSTPKRTAGSSPLPSILISRTTTSSISATASVCSTVGSRGTR